MDSKTFIESAQEFARAKDIDRPQMIRILEETFRATIRRKFEHDDNFDVIINLDQGDLEIWRFREIVANDEEEFDDTTQVRLVEALKIEEDFEVGEELAEEVKLEFFGRRAVQTARQTFIQKVKDLEKDRLYDKYKDLVGEIINGEIYQILSREILMHDNEGNEL
ncbi:MAG: NusA N-terminal domain-containing protein, partial [Catalinimonas sp.]